MSAEFGTTTLGEIAANHNGAIAIGPFGSAMKADTYSPTGVPVIRGTNISDTRAWKGDWVYVPEDFADRMHRCIVRAEDIVLPHRGSIGEVAIIPDGKYERYIISTSLMKITINKEKAYPLFVYYYLRSPKGRREILKYASQVGTPGIGQPLASLRKITVPFPLLDEQKKVAHILRALDDKIEMNRRMSETMEEMAQAIFEDWFIDFGPTRAKMEGRTPYLAPEFWSLFPDKLDDEGKPNEWKVLRIDGILEMSYGKALPATDRVSGPFPVYGSGGITGYHNESLVTGPSIVVGRKGTVGSLYWEDGCFYPIDTVFYVKPKLSLAVCYSYLRSLRLGEMNTDAAVPGLNRSNVYRLLVTVPPPEILKAFDDVAKALRAKMSINGDECRTLAHTRDLLIPKLMSGEIRVRDVENIVGAAL